ncbi:MAG: helix-turn-helix domain-containing protein [Hydrogenophaga sp.]|nr:helix-turn-helix domain-containing protein [Hydrogenophaga sp.]
MSDVVGEGNGMSGEPVSRPIRLKEAREAAGLHIAALAASLKVPIKKLEALEAGRYSELPDLTFARALASSACRQLKVDPAPILQQIPLGASPKLGDHGQALNAPFNPGRDEEPFNPLSWLSRPALLAAIALLLGALVIVFLPKAESPPVVASVAEPVMAEPVVVAEPVAAQEPAGAAAQGGVVPGSADMASPAEVPTAADVAAAPADAAPAVAVATPATPVGASAGSLLSIVATGESWVEVVNGSGNVVAKRLMQAGDVMDFSAAPPYTVVLGKADAARVNVRGKPFDTAPFARSNVARFEVK